MGPEIKIETPLVVGKEDAGGCARVMEGQVQIKIYDGGVENGDLTFQSRPKFGTMSRHSGDTSFLGPDCDVLFFGVHVDRPSARTVLVYLQNVVQVGKGFFQRR